MAKRAPKIDKRARTALRTDKPKSVEDFFDSRTGELLNSKHEAFANMWVQTFNQSDALAAGGYKKPKSDVARRSQARTILRREDVMIRVRAILKERVKGFAVTESFIIFKMLDVYEKAMEKKPIMNNEGEEVGSEYQDLRVALQTLEKLGTNLGMFSKANDDRAGTVVINMNYGDDQKALPVPVIQGEAKRLN